ncbi:MAG: PQQ-binding-like beta-propeller repeat protein [Myxococcota bacterium]|nr:PQQ-binding-like beta-propeller repeat protein [Myxococcota bacterium]
MKKRDQAKRMGMRGCIAGLFCAWCMASTSAVASDSNRNLKSHALKKVFGLSHMISSLVDEPRLLAKTPAQWSHPLVDSDGSIVYVAQNNQTLAGIRLEDGEVLWKRKKLGALGRAMFQWRSELFVGVDQELVVFDRFTGQQKNRVRLGARISGPVEHVKNTLIIPIRPNAFVAFDIEKKAVSWRVSRPQPKGITIFGQAQPTFDRKNEQVLLAFSDGVVMAVKAESGETNWTRELAGSQQPFRDIDTKPLISSDGSTAIVACYSMGLYGIDLLTGKKTWHNPAFKKISHWIGVRNNQRIIAVDGKGQTIGFKPQSKSAAWIYKSRVGVGTAIAPVGDRWVSVSVSTGASALLDKETGRPIQTFHPGSGVRAPMAYSAPYLSLLTNRGTVLVYALGQ